MRGREIMILTVDIGNTNIMLGGFSKDKLAFVACLSTDLTKTADEYASGLLGVLSLYGVARDAIDGAIISSVVPPLNAVIQKAIAFLYGVEPILVVPGIKTGLNIHCDIPSSVGTDIICACVAVNQHYGGPALIVDMGTATNIMVLNGKGAFIGVSIMPGIQMGLNALAEGTAQLPRISLEAPRSVIAKNTAESMRSGIIFGHAAMLDGMIDRICKELPEKPKVYITGGMASFILEYCRHEMILDEHLVLTGLYYLYQKNKA